MSYDFGAEMNSIKDTEVKESEYINAPCILEVAVKNITVETPEGKKPYLEVTFEADDNRISKDRFYLAVEGDSEASAQFKRERIKRLLMNCEANLELPGDGPIKDAIGKKVQVLFKSREYIGVDENQNNKPVIKETIEYSFSEKIGKKINANETYFKGYLRPEDQQKLNGLLMQWERDNPHMVQNQTAQSEPQADVPQAPTTPTIKDDSPF